MFSDSLGFCQLFLDCSLETCLRRNGQRLRALPAETIHMMARKIEQPNPEKNAWEHNSLTVQSPACSSEARYLLEAILPWVSPRGRHHAECFTYSTGGKHKARGLNPALHFVLSGPAPSLYLEVADRSGLTIKEQLHLYVLKLHSAL